MSLFAERQLIELRVPGGKPGKDGSEALQRYCEGVSDDVVTLIHLPKLDWQQMKRRLVQRARCRRRDGQGRCGGAHRAAGVDSRADSRRRASASRR